MPFKFEYICDLLQQVEDGLRPRHSSSITSSPRIIKGWFEKHRGQLNHSGFDGSALLSTLLPEKRTDRVYSIQAATLQQIAGRALGIKSSRLGQLKRWQRPGEAADLADCVESILLETPNAIDLDGVTIEEIDEVLHVYASRCRFSSPKVRSSRPPRPQSVHPEDDLQRLFRRVTPRDAKWLTRLILKDYRPAELDVATVFRCYHPLLPSILQIQDDFTTAITFLETQSRTRGVIHSAIDKSELISLLQPQLGVKIGRQRFEKGRSIKHCLQMGHGRMSCEQKVDGEYAQIHIDLSKGRNCIQIFSKSGKDSTEDRSKLHSAIRSSLQLGTASCKIKKGCILEGELVVYSERESEILHFDKIRKHVPRSGRYIGTEQDSQPHSWERLMIVYFDLLLVDGDSLLGLKQSERFKRLSQLVIQKEGVSELVERQVVDFRRSSAASDLKTLFGACIMAHAEGLVLKPDEPYFDFKSSKRPYIKLKKEYIGKFGDVGDFAVVGARYDAIKAKEYGIQGLKWTHFYVGCLDNATKVQRWGAKPRFVVTNVVELNASQLEFFRRYINPPAVDAADNEAFEIRVERGVHSGRSPSVIFTDPPVFDLRCFSFHREGNTGFFSLRFPVVAKIHVDRDFKDAISFERLQELAEKEVSTKEPEDSQELQVWISALERADPGGALAHSETQLTISSMMTSSSEITSGSTTGHDHLSPIPESPLMVSPRTTQSQRDQLAGTLTVDQRDVGKGPKRRSDLAIKSPRKSKAPRYSASQSSACSARSSHGGFSPTKSQRKPLGDITSSSQPRNNSIIIDSQELPDISIFSTTSFEERALPTYKDDAPSSSAAGSFHTAQSSAPPSPGSTIPSSPPKQPTSSGSCASVGQTNHSSCSYCRVLGSRCLLGGFFFLVSPCISNYLLVSEDLLPIHGPSNFTTNIDDWVSMSTHSMTSSSEVPSSSASNSTYLHKAVLVDFERRDATRVFLLRVEAAKAKARKGETERNEIFNWPLLREINKGEQALKGNASSSIRETRRRIMKKYSIGLL